MTKLPSVQVYIPMSGDFSCDGRVHSTCEIVFHSFNQGFIEGGWPLNKIIQIYQVMYLNFMIFVLKIERYMYCFVGQ